MSFEKLNLSFFLKQPIFKSIYSSIAYIHHKDKKGEKEFGREKKNYAHFTHGIHVQIKTEWWTQFM